MVGSRGTVNAAPPVPRIKYFLQAICGATNARNLFARPVFTGLDESYVPFCVFRKQQ
jgi:hypothetical protein